MALFAKFETRLLFILIFFFLVAVVLDRSEGMPLGNRATRRRQHVHPMPGNLDFSGILSFQLSSEPFKYHFFTPKTVELWYCPPRNRCPRISFKKLSNFPIGSCLTVAYLTHDCLTVSFQLSDCGNSFQEPKNQKKAKIPEYIFPQGSSQCQKTVEL